MGAQHTNKNSKTNKEYRWGLWSREVLNSITLWALAILGEEVSVVKLKAGPAVRTGREGGQGLFRTYIQIHDFL